VRLTKKQREEAVMVLRAGSDAILNNAPWTIRKDGEDGLHAGLEAADAIGLSVGWEVLRDAGYPIANLVDATDYIFDHSTRAKHSALVGLEMAALLEEGWNPGEPIEATGVDWPW
jgi:hypothetical protein